MGKVAAAALQGALVHRAKTVEGPEYEDSLTVDEVSRDKSPFPAVVGRDAMVSQHEVLVRRDDFRPVRTVVAIFLWHVALVQLSAVYMNDPVLHRYRIAGQPDDPLDIALGGVFGVPEHDRIAAFDFAETELIAELIDEETFLIEKARHHAGPFDLYRAIEKQNHQQCDED